MPLKQRHLRIVHGAKTEYRFFEEYKCGAFNLFNCYREKIFNDFDLTKDADVDKLNDMGFELVVRSRD